MGNYKNAIVTTKPRSRRRLLHPQINMQFTIQCPVLLLICKVIRGLVQFLRKGRLAYIQNFC